MIVGLVRKRLLITMNTLETDSVLSGWHFAAKTEERNEQIEKAVEDIEAVLNILKEGKNGLTDDAATMKRIWSVLDGND